MDENSQHPASCGNLRAMVERELKRDDATLCLSYLELSHSEWEELPQILLEHHAQVTRIRICDLGGNSFGKHFARSSGNTNFLTQSLMQFHSLEELDLRDNKLLSDGAVKVLKVLSQTCVSTLEVLDLSENMIRDSGLAALSRANLPYIRSLNLISNFITPRGAAAMQEFLVNNEHGLHTLQLDNNPLGNEGIRVLSDLLREYAHSLQELTLGDTLLSEDGCRPLAAYLRASSCRIQDINLSVNRISAKGLRMLLRSIPSSVRKVDFGGNSFGNESAIYMASRISRLHGLRELDITCVGMGDEGATMLLHSLIRHRKSLALESLYVDGNPMSDEVGVKLVEWKDQEEGLPPCMSLSKVLSDMVGESLYAMCDGCTDTVHYFQRNRTFCLIGIFSAGFVAWGMVPKLQIGK